MGEGATLNPHLRKRELLRVGVLVAALSVVTRRLLAVVLSRLRAAR